MEEYVTETVCGPKKQLSAAYRLCALDYQFSMNLFFFPEKGSPCVAQAGHKGSFYLSPWDGWLIHRVQFMSTS